MPRKVINFYKKQEQRKQEVYEQLKQQNLSIDNKTLFFLGIDPATETGIALLDANNQLLYYNAFHIAKEANIKNQEQNPNKYFYCAYQCFQKQIQNVQNTIPTSNTNPQPLIIATIEHPKFLIARLKYYVLHVQIAIIGIYQVILYQNQIPTLFLSPSEIKKFIVGKGNCQKQDILKWSRKLNYTENNHNIADAIAMAFFLKETLTQKNLLF